MRVAKLITITMMARVIVDENSNEMEILEKSIPNFTRNIEGGNLFNDYEIKDDIECPYNPEEDETESITNEHLAKASKYLTSYDDDEELRRWISKIIQHFFFHPNDFIENVDDDISVWEKLEFSLSCEEFLDLIQFDLNTLRE